MSINIDWETLTGGSDGAALAENIRAFVHDRFQKVALPRMIRSVQVHSFEFGSIPPTIEVKDVCDPLPDFYEDDEDDTGENGGQRLDNEPAGLTSAKLTEDVSRKDDARPLRVRTDALTARSSRPQTSIENAPLMATTPRLMGGGMSNLGYFHLPLSAGLSGTSTPLAAVAGARFPGWPEQHGASTSGHHRGTSFGSITPPSTLTPTSRPTSRHQEWQSGLDDHPLHDGHDSPLYEPQRATHDASPEDLQVVAHIAYNGDVKLSLTAEILLDYPTQSFVGIPLLLNVTGLKFDGIGIVAYIKKKAHFCFLAPEDAEAVLDPNDDPGSTGERPRVGGLIEEIRLESEVGQKEDGKQVLKNVGKIEKFILEQVRRIFEDEFVYPSFWTFLV
ncbi:MMM1-like protein [Elsinoe fawcettii]|nr:MMM1-like protein [Elsinoe fawcettii]